MALNEGSGNIPPPRCGRRRSRRTTRCALNEGSGNIPPPRHSYSNRAASGVAVAQRREREYSPSKHRGGGNGHRCGDRSTKGAGIFPLQGRSCRSGRLVRRALNEGSGNIPPPSTRTRTGRPAATPSLNEGSGNIPPPRPAGSTGSPGRAQALNEGSGNIPPPSHRHDRRRRAGRGRSTKGAGIFPLQGGCQQQGVVEVVRSTKGAGIFPLQGRSKRRWPRLACTPLNEGSGNIPPPSCVNPAALSLVLVPAQRREREYSPSKWIASWCCRSGL